MISEGVWSPLDLKKRCVGCRWFKPDRKNGFYGEWVYGFCLKAVSTLIAVDTGLVDGYFGLHEVIPETVEQYTGLKDKAMKGELPNQKKEKNKGRW